MEAETSLVAVTGRRKKSDVGNDDVQFAFGTPDGGSRRSPGSGRPSGTRTVSQAGPPPLKSELLTAHLDLVRTYKANVWSFARVSRLF